VWRRVYYRTSVDPNRFYYVHVWFMVFALHVQLCRMTESHVMESSAYRPLLRGTSFWLSKNRRGTRHPDKARKASAEVSTTKSHTQNHFRYIVQLTLAYPVCPTHTRPATSYPPPPQTLLASIMSELLCSYSQSLSWPGNIILDWKDFVIGELSC